MEVHYRDPEPAVGVSDAEVESVMKMLMAYQKARAEGIGQPNPELDEKHLLGAMQNSLPKDCPIDEGLKIPSHATQPELAPTSDEVIPKPFFVLKTKNEKQQRVYINMCGSHKIQPPDYGEDTVENIDEIRKKLQDFDPANDPDCPDVRFPCSCLDPVLQKDKKGKTYVIYDVCYNRTVVESAMSVKPLKVFIINLAFSWLSQKYKTQLSSDFKLLEGRKYKGKEVGKHIIRVDPKKRPFITELPDDDDDAEPAIPLLLRDKHGRNLSGDEVQGSCKSDEIVNSDRYRELPEWVPEFYPSDPVKDEVAPKNHQDKTAQGVDSKTSQLGSSREPARISESQGDRYISLNTLTGSHPQKEPSPSHCSLAEPWLPTGMFRELNTPAPDPDISSQASDLNIKSPVPNLEAPSTTSNETTGKKAPAAKFKFQELKKKVEKSEDCDRSKQDDDPYETLEENLTKPKVQTEYIGRPVVTIVIIVTFPLDFIGLEDMHVHMTSTGIFIDTKAYGPLEVKLQFYVSPTGVQAEYKKYDRILRFELPIYTYAQALKLKL